MVGHGTAFERALGRIAGQAGRGAVGQRAGDPEAVRATVRSASGTARSRASAPGVSRSSASSTLTCSSSGT
ncbi:hypothetical protein BIV23_10565 [Streptomyces monashensis]|uniref:Uncharacterized protein n=1 Tax=Streptomyces monashensis TaxID=1678012 RepID=A0A1S2QHX5_9ACTN|nr:hypothetical protein BIV23_10565 [Streptomyces monashensis]